MAAGPGPEVQWSSQSKEGALLGRWEAVPGTVGPGDWRRGAWPVKGGSEGAGLSGHAPALLRLVRWVPPTVSLGILNDRDRAGARKYVGFPAWSGKGLVRPSVVSLEWLGEPLCLSVFKPNPNGE